MSAPTVADLRRQIADSEKQRDAFVALVSHELKTPLTPLKAIAQLIRSRIRKAREGGNAPDLDSLERNLMTLERQVDRMSALVNDLLEVSRAGRGTFELQPEPIDVAKIARDVIARYKAITQEEGRHTLSLDSPDEAPAVADRSRVEQAIWNIVGNAIKFSPRGGRVAVRVASTADAVDVEVTDEGIGIGAEELERVGRSAFVRGARASQFAGVGAGLYLARLVVEGHGGSIEVQSEGEEKGTLVRLRLPRGKAL